MRMFFFFLFVFNYICIVKECVYLRASVQRWGLFSHVNSWGWAAAERGLLEMAASIRFGRDDVWWRGEEREEGEVKAVFAMDPTD